MKKRIFAILLAISLIATPAIADFAGGGGDFGNTWNALRQCATNIVPSVTNTYNIGSASKVFANVYATAVNATNWVVASGGYVGLGASKGREVWTDATVDLANYLGVAVAIGNGTPTQTQAAEDLYVEGKTEIDGVLYADGGTNTTQVVATSMVMGAYTLTSSEWQNLDGVNQTLATTSKPTFAGATIAGVFTTSTITGTSLVNGTTYSVQKQHDEIGILLDNLTAPKAIVGFTGTGATTTTETGYENGAGRTWTYTGGLATDKIFQGSTYVYSFDGVDSYLSTPDTEDMTFDDASGNKMSIGGWVQVIDFQAYSAIMSKWNGTTGSELREWFFGFDVNDKVILSLYDESANVFCSRTTDAEVSDGWHFIVAVGDFQNGGGATQANNITIYVDGVAVASTATNNGSYVGMENLATTPYVGAVVNTGSAIGWFYGGDMGRLFVTGEALSAATIWKLYEKTRGFYNK